MSTFRAHLSRESILKAALRLADSGGVEALSMRRIADELGVKAMSLYNHVRNKDGILDGIVELVMGEIEVPDPQIEWLEALRRRALSAHEVLLRHRWATLVIVSHANTGPVALRYVDATLGVLRRAGFSYELADRIWNALDNHIYGFTLQELTFPFEPSQYSSVAAEYLPTIDEAAFPYLAELTKLVGEGKHAGVQQFEFGLDLLLEGIERMRDLELLEGAL